MAKIVWDLTLKKVFRTAAGETYVIFSNLEKILLDILCKWSTGIKKIKSLFKNGVIILQ